MFEILDATEEIRSFIFAVISVANNTEGRDPNEVGFTLELLNQQIEARCDFIDETCKVPSLARQATLTTRKKKA